MRVRFYGGPWNGEVKDLPSSTHRWEVPMTPAVEVMGVPQELQGQIAIYERRSRRLVDPSNVIFFEVPFVLLP